MQILSHFSPVLCRQTPFASRFGFNSKFRSHVKGRTGEDHVTAAVFFDAIQKSIVVGIIIQRDFHSQRPRKRSGLFVVFHALVVVRGIFLLGSAFLLRKTFSFGRPFHFRSIRNFFIRLPRDRSCKRRSTSINFQSNLILSVLSFPLHVQFRFPTLFKDEVF